MFKLLVIFWNFKVLFNVELLNLHTSGQSNAVFYSMNMYYTDIPAYPTLYECIYLSTIPINHIPGLIFENETDILPVQPDSFRKS